MHINKIQLVTTTTAVGRGANDGVYPPGGLLTIAKALTDNFSVEISIEDQHHQDVLIQNDTDLVGIQVASTLCYPNSLKLAKDAKEAGKLVVLGGPHVTSLYRQIADHQPWIDFLIRGKGELPMVELVKALQNESDLNVVPSLSWKQGQRWTHNQKPPGSWNFDDYAPLPLPLLSSGAESYWQAFRHTINRDIDAAFLLFTHFGCGYRQLRIDTAEKKRLPVFQPEGTSSFCSYCSLDDPPLSRDPRLILTEIRHYLDEFALPTGSRIHLKCYGDNIGPQLPLVRSLAKAIGSCKWWNDYNISWTFYCQSSYLHEELASLLRAIGATHLYIGFDGANDEIQRGNGLGTSMKSHLRAVELCQKYNILIQAGSVVGLAGETPASLEELRQFFERLRQADVLERINSAILFIIPGTPAYEMLTLRELQIKEWDLLPTTKVRQLWIKHFCPKVSLELLQEYADAIDELSPGPHASMGFESSRLKEEKINL